MSVKEEVIEVIEARAGMYETIASLYFDRLSEEQIKAMAQWDYSELMESDNELVASGFNDIYRYLRKRNTGTRQELSIDFSSCFLGTHSYKGLVAQPYESLFMDASGTLNGKPRTVVYNLYKKERVSLKSEYNYPDDHLSFECEFMSILCRRCIQALEAGDKAEALRLLDVQEDFMRDHLCVWFRRLHDLSLKFIKTRFYRGVLNITQGFFDEEVETIQDLRSAIEEGFDEAPEAQLADGGAEGCASEADGEADAAPADETQPAQADAGDDDRASDDEDGQR